MRGLLLMSGILAASFAVHNLTPGDAHLQISPEIITRLQQEQTFDLLNQLEQRLSQDLNQFLELIGVRSGFISQQDLNRQLDQVLQDMSELNQQMMDQAEVLHLKIRRLPTRPESQQPNTSNQEVGRIQVTSGDPGVTKNSLQTAVQAVQNISLPILKSNLWEPSQPSRIVLFSSRNSYGNSLIRAGVPTDQVRNIVTKTGGLTVGSDIWIPLYNLHSKADLANTLTHELTHVVLNQRGLGDSIPTWVNEGIAWHDGITAMQQVDPRMAKRIENASNRQIEQVANAGQLLPLTVDEQGILNARYNVEWEDYLAVQNLIQQQGINKFRAFLTGSLQSGVKSSFQHQYGISLSEYENEFVRSL